ncbi:unnamed protein product, partial [Rotaria sp. Silwood2]
TVLKDHMIEIKNLFHEIYIDDDLCLSLILNSISTGGITSIMHSLFNMNEKTRILHYCYVNEERFISGPAFKSKDNMMEKIFNQDITHMVVGIRSGIHVVVVLQLSADYDNGIDNLLEKISQNLIDNIFNISTNDKQLLSQIITTRIFSNIPDLIGNKTLSGLCTHITHIKQLIAVHRPLQCFLLPIQCFYPSYIKIKTNYVPLNLDTLTIIKQYLFPLWFKMKQLTMFVRSDTEELLKQYFKPEFDQIQHDIQEIQERYSTEIIQIRNLIAEFHSGKLKQKLMSEIFIKIFEPLLENKIDLCLERLQPLREKVMFIKDLKQKNIKYLNMENVSIQQNDDIKTVLLKIIKPNKEELIFCSTEHLKYQDSPKWSEYYSNWIRKDETNSSIGLIYVDFSYITSFHLSKTQIFSIQPLGNIEQQTDSLNRPISSTKEPIKSPEKQSEETRKRLSSPELVNSSNTPEKSSEKNETVPIDASPRARQSLTQSASEDLSKINDESKETLPTFYDAMSSKESIVNDTTHGTIPLNSVREDVTSLISPSQPVLEPASEENDLSRDVKSSTNSNEPSNTSDQLLNEQCDPLETQFKTSSTPIISTLRTTSSTDVEPINPEVPLASQTASQSSPTLTDTSTLEKHSYVKDHGNETSSTLSRSDSQVSQRTRDQNNNKKESIDQMNSQEPLTIECIQSSSSSSSELQRNSSQEQSPVENLSIRSNSASATKKRRRPNSSGLTTDNCINVLLLGESGVGKSTFINALANYITFETFEKSHSSEPLVAIPVSFMITVGDHFEEKVVKLGNEDSNEDHEHPGQSVTQNCRSYVFPLKDTQTTIRMIDTPGVRDVRGLTQDDLNVQHIISYISNLSHLNAICILLKPDESRLNIIFRSYLDRLLNFLGEDARNNIIFCFTNTRAMFFTPGNTAPLLKEMISSCPIKDIPFNKSNTFCFDNESFRYLVALQNGIKFDKHQEDEYEQSWTNSVIESNRLLQYICGTELKSYFENEWRSIEHVQLKIQQMIRPMLDTTRNLFQHIVSLERDSNTQLIKLNPVFLNHSSSICYTCESTCKRYNDIYIFEYDLHIDSDPCNKCDCVRENHVAIDYHIQYELSNEIDEQSLEHKESTVEQLKNTIIKFGKFYAKIQNISSQVDPISSALKRMIAEEQKLCSQNDSTCLNPQLYDKLVSFEKEYEHELETSILTDTLVDLSTTTVINQEKTTNMYQETRETALINDSINFLFINLIKNNFYMHYNE